MAKGDFVEVLIDAGSGAAREYVVEATKAGRTVEVRSSRTTVEVRELTRTGGVVRTAVSACAGVENSVTCQLGSSLLKSKPSTWSIPGSSSTT